MATKKYRALILDMDGTLLNSKEMVSRSLDMLAAEYGIALTAEQRRRGFGCTAITLMEELRMVDPKAAAERWRVIMDDMLDEVPLYDGVPEVLAAAVRRGIVTSQTRGELTRNLGRLHIEDRFECTVTVDDVTYTKPHPQPLLRCLERMGLSAEDALYVGDSEYDYGCARDAGVDFGLATWGAENIAEFENALYLFRSPPEMLEVILPK